MKKHNWRPWIHLIPAILTIALILGCASRPEMKEIPEKLDPSEIATEEKEFMEELASAVGDYDDGIYTGTAAGYGGDIKVEVTVEDRQITEVEILSATGENEPFFSRSRDVIGEILRLQTWEVDAITGATYSSNGIKAAVQNAITGKEVKTKKAKTNSSGNRAALKTVSYTVPSGGYKDGTYTGSATGFGGNIGVCVTVKNGKITGVNVTSAPGETASYLSSAKGVISRVISRQTPNVDTVSGATYSSTGILNAVKNALSRAGGSSSSSDKMSAGGTASGNSGTATPKVNNHFQNGTYVGIGDGYGGRIKVTVTVSNGQITKVNIDSAADETPAYLSKATTLISKIIEQQTWKLDAVSGATFSSQGILEAVADAIASGAKSTPVTPQEPDRVFADGTYTGTGTGYQGSRIRVRVTIKSGKISGIEILEAQKEGKLYQRAAEGTTEAIMNRQDWSVDSISGATFTSNGIKEAVAGALDQAEKAAETASAAPSSSPTPTETVQNVIYSGTATVEPNASQEFSAYTITVNITVQIKNGETTILSSEVVSDTNRNNKRFLDTAWKTMKPALMGGNSIDSVSGATCSARAIRTAWDQAVKQMGGQAG